MSPTRDSDSSDDGEEYVVEKVLDVRETKGVREYMVRWENYGPEFDEWLTASDMNCDLLVKNFWEERRRMSSPAKKKTTPKKVQRPKPPPLPFRKTSTEKHTMRTQPPPHLGPDQIAPASRSSVPGVSGSGNVAVPDKRRVPEIVLPVMAEGSLPSFASHSKVYTTDVPTAVLPKKSGSKPAKESKDPSSAPTKNPFRQVDVEAVKKLTINSPVPKSPLTVPTVSVADTANRDSDTGTSSGSEMFGPQSQRPVFGKLPFGSPRLNRCQDLPTETKTVAAADVVEAAQPNPAEAAVPTPTVQPVDAKKAEQPVEPALPTTTKQPVAEVIPTRKPPMANGFTRGLKIDKIRCFVWKDGVVYAMVQFRNSRVVENINVAIVKRREPLVLMRAYEELGEKPQYAWNATEEKFERVSN